jgi:predicted transposase YbfD/YdcC
LPPERNRCRGRAAPEKSNEIMEIRELHATLALADNTVNINAMGTQTAVVETIQSRGANYILAAKDRQSKLAESIGNFWNCFCVLPAAYTPDSLVESVEKGNGRIETRRCRVFDQRGCLPKPNQWSGLKYHAVVEK